MVNDLLADKAKLDCQEMSLLCLIVFISYHVYIALQLFT